MSIDFLSYSKSIKILKTHNHAMRDFRIFLDAPYRALINPILAPNSGYRFSLNLEIPGMRGSRPYFKESMIKRHMVGREGHGCIAINLPIIFAEVENFATNN